MTNTYYNANDAFPNLLHKVLDRGEIVHSRNGTTRELTMQQFTLLEPNNAEITTPGRRAALPAQIAEMMWLLAGRDDIAWLSHYLPRAADFSDDGRTWRGAYGPRLRAFGFKDQFSQPGFDQLQYIVDLLQEDPNTRRAVFNIYDPATDSTPGKDIPCNNWVHFLPRNGVLHAHVAIRSNDLFWGWSGINNFEWTTLLTIVARLANLRRGSITFSISSLHLYERHWAKAEDIIKSSRENGVSHLFPKANPQFEFEGTLGQFDDLVSRWFNVEKAIRGELTDVDVPATIREFPEPLLRSWLWVLYAWNTGDLGLLDQYEGTSLHAAAVASPARQKPKPKYNEDRSNFTGFAAKLHLEKHTAYGDSWKKRGEMLGIMANIARKVDRLGVAGGGDTSADTAIDLLIYLIKYSTWLQNPPVADGEEHVMAVSSMIGIFTNLPELDMDNDEIISNIRDGFDHLEHLVTEKRDDRGETVLSLIQLAYPLAVRLWTEEQEQEQEQEVNPWATPLPVAVGHAERNAERRFDGYDL